MGKEVALMFNIDKFKFLHLKFNDNIKYKLNESMTESEQEKDKWVFTVLITGTLLWNDQIYACASINKANKLICWITHTLIRRKKDFFKSKYTK